MNVNLTFYVYKMNHFIYVSYPNKTVKFNIFKNYGLDKDLQLGDKPIPRRINIEEIKSDYRFLLVLLPMELWLKIFDMLHKEALITYKKLVGCEMEYNIHRLFKKRNHECNYRNFQIKIKVSPGMFQFYSTMYHYEKDIREYYGYTTYICHNNLKIIDKVSDYVTRFTKCKCIRGGLNSEDCWGISLTTNYDEDFVFSEGFNCEKIVNKLELHKKNGKIKTFKTLEYYSEMCKEIIDNFYSEKNRIRNTYKYK